jgi:hypothetical protein
LEPGGGVTTGADETTASDEFQNSRTFPATLLHALVEVSVGVRGLPRSLVVAMARLRPWTARSSTNAQAAAATPDRSTRWVLTIAWSPLRSCGLAEARPKQSQLPNGV